MYNFFNIQEDQKKEWNHCYINPYDNDFSYYWYLNQREYVADQWYHFKSDGHRAWADCLINYVKEYNLL